MNQRILLIVTLALLVLPAASFAMKDMDSGGMEMDHNGKDMTEDMIMLGTAAQTGVRPWLTPRFMIRRHGPRWPKWARKPAITSWSCLPTNRPGK